MTTTAPRTVQDVLNSPLPDNLADALRLVGNFGDQLAAIDEVVDGVAETNTALLSQKAAIISCVSVLTADSEGGAATGPRIIGEDTSTPSSTVVAVGDDGVTLTFENPVTTVRVKYIPLPENDITAAFPSGA